MREGWEIRKLEDCISFIKNGANIKQSKNAAGYPITRIETLSGGKFNRDKMGYADIFELTRFSGYILNDGDVLMSHINSKAYVGRSVVYDKRDGETIIHGMNLLRIITTPEVKPKYLYLFTLSHRFKKQIASIRKDAVNQSSVAIGDLKKLLVPVPSIAEQEKIVAELDCLTGIIEKKKQQLEELDKLAQSIFYDMFGDPITNEKVWPVKLLGKVCDVRDGTHDSPKYVEHSDFLLITSKNIVDGSIDFSNINYIKEEDYIAINKRSKVDDGDIIMAMIGTIGKPIIVRLEDYKFCIKNVALIKFFSPGEVSNIYVRALLDSPAFANYIKSLNKGGTQKFVALGTIRNLPIPVPPLDLQSEFAKKIEAIEKQKELVKRSIVETETLFNSRMGFWFN